VTTRKFHILSARWRPPLPRSTLVRPESQRDRAKKKEKSRVGKTPIRTGWGHLDNVKADRQRLKASTPVKLLQERMTKKSRGGAEHYQNPYEVDDLQNETTSNNQK